MQVAPVGEVNSKCLFAEYVVPAVFDMNKAYCCLRAVQNACKLRHAEPLSRRIGGDSQTQLLADAITDMALEQEG